MDSFGERLMAAEPLLRRALVARLGPDVGRESAADAIAYGWEHRDRIAGMENPMGYLYRVGQSRSRRYRQRTSPGVAATEAVVDGGGVRHVEPGLDPGLAALSRNQRVAVLLVHGHGYPQAEVAALLDVSESSLRTHLRRGMEKLRRHLGVPEHE